jgi:hypothetical protein
MFASLTTSFHQTRPRREFRRIETGGKLSPTIDRYRLPQAGARQPMECVQKEHRYRHHWTEIKQ